MADKLGWSASGLLSNRLAKALLVTVLQAMVRYQKW